MPSWAAMTREERGAWIRWHRTVEGMSREDIRDLFALTNEGVDAIFNGADWSEDFLKLAPQLHR